MLIIKLPIIRHTCHAWRHEREQISTTSAKHAAPACGSTLRRPPLMDHKCMAYSFCLKAIYLAALSSHVFSAMDHAIAWHVFVDERCSRNEPKITLKRIGIFYAEEVAEDFAIHVRQLHPESNKRKVIVRKTVTKSSPARTRNRPVVG